MSTRTYTTEDERQRLHLEAMREYHRTGVMPRVIPAALADYERTRYQRSPMVPPRPDAPAPASAGAVGYIDDRRLIIQASSEAAITAEQVDRAIRESGACMDSSTAMSEVARKLRQAGATPGQVSDAMRRVQAERDRLAWSGW